MADQGSARTALLPIAETPPHPESGHAAPDPCVQHGDRPDYSRILIPNQIAQMAKAAVGGGLVTSELPKMGSGAKPQRGTGQRPVEKFL